MPNPLRPHEISASIVKVGYLALMLAAAGCPGRLTEPERFVVATDLGDGGACPDIPSFFAATCTSSTCHSSDNKAQGLDLQSPDVASRLVGVSATEGPGVLVDPSSPADSILYQKLSPDPPFGARMPLAERPLDSSMLACVLAWISDQSSLPDAESPQEEGHD
jgi:hypothetical protein